MSLAKAQLTIMLGVGEYVFQSRPWVVGKRVEVRPRLVRAHALERLLVWCAQHAKDEVELVDVAGESAMRLTSKLTPCP